MQMTVRTESLEAANHGRARQSVFACLLDDPVVERNPRMLVAFANEDSQQATVFGRIHFDLIEKS
jgi:hypothetical protein